MEDILFMLILLLVPLLIVGIPSVLVVWGYKRLRKTRFGKYAFILPIAFIAFISYEIYFAIYPKDSFYKEDFERYAQMKFPASGKILYKSADFPDMHGHYTSVSIVRLSTSEFNILQTTIKKNKEFRLSHILYNTAAYEDAGYKEENIMVQYQRGKLLLSFFKDRQTIVVQKRISEFSEIN